MHNATANPVISLSEPTNAPTQALRWTSAGKLHWLEPDTGRLLSWQEGTAVSPRKTQHPTSALAVCVSGQLLLGIEKRLCIAPSAIAATHKKAAPGRILATVDAVDPRTIIGGGRTDRSGNFVFGTRNIGEDRRPIGSFYQYSKRHGLRRLALPTVTWAANICFDRAGRRMYFGDATSNIIQQCCYDPHGAQTRETRPFASAAHGTAIVDAIVDSDDCLWIVQRAQGLADTLVRYGADGTVLDMIALPAGQASSLAFGGPSLDRLFMVGETGALSELPRWLGRGLADNEFDDMPADPAHELLPPNPVLPGRA